MTGLSIFHTDSTRIHRHNAYGLTVFFSFTDAKKPLDLVSLM